MSNPDLPEPAARRPIDIERPVCPLAVPQMKRMKTQTEGKLPRSVRQTESPRQQTARVGGRLC